MKIENGQLVLDTPQRCYGCHHIEGQDEDKGSGLVAVRIPCTTCNGTRRGKRGGRNGCKSCYDGTQYSNSDYRACSNCDGTGLVPETIYDRIPDDVWASMNFEVVRSSRGQSWHEQHLGIGCYSVVDYGACNSQSDAELIAEVSDPRHAPQACNLVAGKDDLTVAGRVVILTSRTGYSVIGELA